MFVNKEVTVSIYFAIENFSIAFPSPKMQTSNRVNMFWV